MLAGELHFPGGGVSLVGTGAVTRACWCDGSSGGKLF
jgi:hypothetical protein